MKIWAGLVAAVALALGGAGAWAQQPSANEVWAGPASGGSGPAGFRKIVNADLGALATACASHQWINTISSGGVPGCSQPSASDLSNGVTGSGFVVLGTSPMISGGTISGATVTGLPAPSGSSDAATKQYVDSSASAGLVPHMAVVVATATALPTNAYNNGSSGVGATLTASSNGALTVDGISVSSSQRVLVKNESTAANNGIYTVTNAGSGSAEYVLTRATDANSPGTGSTSEIGFGTYVLATSGTINAGTGWSVTSSVATIGTSAINWTQFSAQATTAINVDAGGATSISNGVSGATLIDNSGSVGVSGPINVMGYRASGSKQNTTGTISSSSSALALAGAIDFQNGEGIRVNHAGAAYTLNAPGTPSVTPTCASSCSTGYTYKVAAIDGAGGVGAATSASTSVNNNGTLGISNSNAISWTAPTGTPPSAYAVFKDVSGTYTLIAVTTLNSFTDYGATSFTTVDWVPSAAPASSLNDWLLTTISSGGGTTSLTLAASASNAVSGGAVYHDDTAAFAAALSASPNIAIPPGTYYLTSQITSSPSGALASGSLVCSPGATLFFPNSDGVLISESLQSQSSLISDCAILTGRQGGGKCIEVSNSQTYFGQFNANNSVRGTTCAGADGLGVADYWTYDYYGSSASQVSWVNDNFYGGVQGPYGQLGTCIYLTSVIGSQPGGGVGYDFVHSYCVFNGMGIEVGTGIQALAVTSGSAILNGITGIKVDSGDSDIQQLVVADSQIAGNGRAYDGETAIESLYIHHNLIATNAGQTDIYFATDNNQGSVDHNTFQALAAGVTSCIALPGAAQFSLSIEHNFFNSCGDAITAASGASGVYVHDNQYANNTVNVSNSAGAGLILGHPTQVGYSSNTTQATNTTEYYGGGGIASSYTIQGSIVMPSAGSQGVQLQNLYVSASGGPGTGQLYTATLYKNGSATALTCQMTGSTAGCTDTAHTVSFAAGDHITLQVISSPSAAGPVGIGWGYQQTDSAQW